MQSIDTLNDLNAYELARHADVAIPDSQDSAGAELLLHVRDALVEAIEWEIDNDRSLDEALVAIEEDRLHEIADGAPSVYTYTRWQQFVDLAAWNEDVEELSGGEEDMTTLAGLALYMVAERLARRLLEVANDEACE